MGLVDNRCLYCCTSNRSPMSTTKHARGGFPIPLQVLAWPGHLCTSPSWAGGFPSSAPNWRLRLLGHPRRAHRPEWPRYLGNVMWPGRARPGQARNPRAGRDIPGAPDRGCGEQSGGQVARGWDGDAQARQRMFSPATDSGACHPARRPHTVRAALRPSRPRAAKRKCSPADDGQTAM